MRWYRKAADQGSPRSQYSLGWMYAIGEGVPKDYIEAYKWVNLAAAAGLEEAVFWRPVLENQMTPTQIAEAQRLSREFRPGQTAPSN